MAKTESAGFLSFEQAAKALGISRATMNRRLADPKNFPNAWKTGPGRTAHWRIPLEDIEAFKQRHTRDELENEPLTEDV